MLREVGKHGWKAELTQFLDKHVAEMPRTILRYSIEYFSPEERQYYMAKPMYRQRANIQLMRLHGDETGKIR